MTDLDDHLDDELRAIAQALVSAAPDAMPLIRDESPIAIRRRRRVPVVAAAAAAITVAGVAGLLATSHEGGDGTSRNPESVPPTDSPVVLPDLYPVLANLSSDSYATLDIESLGYGGSAARAGAVVGRRTSSGAIEDVIRIEAGVSFDERELELWRTGESVAVFGLDATVYHNTEVGGPGGSMTVVWSPISSSEQWLDGRPFVAVTGDPSNPDSDPRRFLDTASADFLSFTATDWDGPLDLVIGPLPDGYEIVLGPAPANGYSAVASLRTSTAGSWVETRPTMVPISDAQAATVNDADAWVIEHSTFDVDGEPIEAVQSEIVWQVDDGTWARAVVDGDDDPVAFAESVSFVDRAAWEALYHPAVGTPDPDFVPISSPFDYPETSDPGVDFVDGGQLSPAQQESLDDYIASLPGGTLANAPEVFDCTGCDGSLAPDD